MYEAEPLPRVDKMEEQRLREPERELRSEEREYGPFGGGRTI